MTLIRHDFPSADVLAEALAQRIGQQLGDAVEKRGNASLAVSGGKTPARLFRALSRQPLDWSRIGVTLVDDRFVPDGDERSNARLVKQNLLQGLAAGAAFFPLFHPGLMPEEAARKAERGLEALDLPLDAVVLGMGGDAHTASFFPDAEGLSALFSNPDGRVVLPVIAQSAGEPRLTLSAQVLGSARFVALHIEGREKQEVLEEALSGGTKPIATMIAMAPAPIEVFWAP